MGEQLGIGETLGFVGARERLQAPPGEHADRQGEDDGAGVEARPGQHPAGAPAAAEKPLRDLDTEHRRGGEDEQPGEGERCDAAHAAQADHRAEQRRQPELVGGELEE